MVICLYVALWRTVTAEHEHRQPPGRDPEKKELLTEVTLVVFAQLHMNSCVCRALLRRTSAAGNEGEESCSHSFTTAVEIKPATTTPSTTRSSSSLGSYVVVWLRQAVFIRTRCICDGLVGWPFP